MFFLLPGIFVITLHDYVMILLLFFILQTTKYWKTRNLLPLKHVRVIAEGIRGHLPSGYSQIWEDEPLYIPSIIPTTNTCNNPFNFFEVKYKIKVIQLFEIIHG